MSNYNVLKTAEGEKIAAKMWTQGVPMDSKAYDQIRKAAELPFIYRWVAAMADAHVGIGATVGTVLPTKGAIIPAAVGVDGGCGMIAQMTGLTANDLPESLTKLRFSIERAVPVGTPSKETSRSQGSWQNTDKMLPFAVQEWKKVERFNNFLVRVADTKHQKIVSNARPELQLGTLGGGNHFIEICLDENDNVWVMLHSGSRGIGNKLGRYFIELAKKDMEKYFIHLPDRDLAYLVEGSENFDDYIDAMLWVQHYAKVNREVMMRHVLQELAWAVKHTKDLKALGLKEKAVNCFSGETRVITKNGIREIRSLVRCDHELLTPNGWIKSPIKSFGKQKLMRITLSRCGVKKEIYTTPEHGWIISPVQRTYTLEKTTLELLSGDRLASIFPKKQKVTSEAEGIARGFVFGDGSKTSKNRSCANFCGTKDEEVLPLFIENGFGLISRRYKKLTRINGLPGVWKTKFPSLNESVNYLYGWLSGYFAADGNVDKSGRPTLGSSKKENLEFVRDLTNKIGIGTFGIRKRMRKGYSNEPTPFYMLGIMRNDLTDDFFLISSHRERFRKCRVAERRHWKVVSVEETNRFEEVYCAVVDKYHCFSLEDNILTQNCHHNYAAKEHHFGENVWVTRKGAVRARGGDLGIIPGSMGTRSFIVEGLGNPDSFHSCSHGAGRVMSRSEAKKKITLDQHVEAVKGIECRVDEGVIDESPAAYKSITAVMEAQKDLVKIRHTLKQVLCVKG